MEHKEIRMLACCFLGLLASGAAAQNETEEKEDSLQGALKGVIVSAERSDIKVTDGKISYDLNQIANRYAVDNVWEALAKLPGITEKEDTYQLTGMAVTVILNGRPTTMTPEQLATLLRNTPVDRVAKVEVMHGAPPQYHVRGAAINVVLKQSRRYSFQGEITGDYMNRFFSYGGMGGNVRMTSPKVTLDVMYNVNRRKSLQTMDLYSLHTLKDKVYDIRQYQEIRQKSWAHNLRTALDWHLSERDNLSVAYTGDFSPSGRADSHSQGNYQQSNVHKDTNDDMHNVTLAYISGFGLQIGGDYTYYKSHERQQLEVDYTEGGMASLLMDGGQHIDRYNVYADQHFKLKRDWTFGLGGSYTYANDRDFQTYGKVEGTMQTQDTHSALKEHTANFYVSAGKIYESGTTFSVSATGEYYKMGNYSRWSVYPQASFTYMPSSSHIFQLEFSTDKTYPSYWDMQSSVSYVDGYSELWGTPGLRPAKEYDITASYIFHQKYSFTLFYERTNDYFEQAAYQSPERLALIYQRLNWDYEQMTGLQINLPFTITKWYHTRLSLSEALTQQRADHYHDIAFNRKKWVTTLSLDNSFKIRKGLLFNLSGIYQSPSIQGTYNLKSAFIASVSAKYTFAKDKASVIIKCNDLFNTGLPKAYVRYDVQHMDLNMANYLRSVSVHFSYRFGGYKEKEVKKVDTTRFGH